MNKYWKSGDPFVWLTGVALMFSLLMIAGLMYLIAAKGLGFFWPSDLAEVKLKDGSVFLGEITGHEKAKVHGPEGEDVFVERTQLKIGNRDIYGLDFKWIDDNNIEDTSYPKYAVALERREWGNMYGFIKQISEGGNVICTGNEGCWPVLESQLPVYSQIYEEIKGIEKGAIGGINREIEHLRLEIRGEEMGSKNEEKISRLEAQIKEEEARYREQEEKLAKLYSEFGKEVVTITSVDGRDKEMPLGNIVRAYRPNSLGWFGKASLYLSKVWEFVSDEPREANTEGGVFPAIFGTILMVLIMSVVVLPFGVLAALYLREYAKQGTLVRIVRICVNNLAGVPSIVFGVFAVGFFIYGMGSTLDSIFFKEALPNPTFGTGGILWASLTLALLTVPVVIVATEEGLAAVSKEIRDGSLALGATKFETTWKIVIPSAMPAILTGLILAIARATGEVAPLMITGVVKLAPQLPVDGYFPYLHLERKFMHLGFHIYDVGFQSPNVEAAKPMVFTTALLLIIIVVVLNLAAIIIRNRLRKKYTTSAV
ncbi:MAG TPA: phosphate ABC transporter permease PstA [Thermodesulfobacteriota bacterium]|mgnify:FL=1|nr:phosphate ABC transporter permease PstA [Thermodesulfobacteriota bacterium]